MHKPKYKLTRKPVQTHTNLTDASIFSKTHHIIFEQPVSKLLVEQLASRLIQDIGRPLSYNGIIVGHIKILVKLSEEEFLFLSLTKLEQVDIKPSSQWKSEVATEFNSVNLDINVLVFGYSKKVIEEIVTDALASFRQDSMSDIYK